MKQVNYKMGALKRKFQTGPKDVEPGTFISKMNESKKEVNSNKQTELSKRDVAIRGLV